MIKYLLFDLDGTITDSADGITNSVPYDFEILGISKKKTNLYGFVVPPLVNFLKNFKGLIEKKQRKECVFTVNIMP